MEKLVSRKEMVKEVVSKRGWYKGVVSSSVFLCPKVFSRREMVQRSGF